MPVHTHPSRQATASDGPFPGQAHLNLKQHALMVPREPKINDDDCLMLFDVDNAQNSKLQVTSAKHPHELGPFGDSLEQNLSEPFTSINDRPIANTTPTRALVRHRILHSGTAPS